VKRKDDEPEWVEAAATGDDEEAVLIAGFLEAQGISTMVEGPMTSPFPEDIGSLGLSRVMVPPEQGAHAKRLLAEREGHGRRPSHKGAHAEEE
jgi:hypothetical protein